MNNASLSLMQRLQGLFAYLAYLLLFTLLLPLLPLRLLWRSRTAPAYRQRIAERFGISALQCAQPAIWVHAVSVGEVVAVTGLVEQLLQRYPQHDIVVTTSTPTGSKQLTDSFARRVKHVYAPYDWPGFVWLFWRRVRPALVIVVETELWPGMLAWCRWHQVPALICNARLSAKSAAGYQRVSWLARPMLQQLTIAAQFADDAERFIALGAEPALVEVCGSVKFDVQIEQPLLSQAAQLRERFALASRSAVWLAASTHEGEDAALLDAHRQLLLEHPASLLILVPRHPERFASVANLVLESGLSLSRVSSVSDGSHCQVLLVDEMGLLNAFYGCCDVAFVGGSLVAVGGHNLIEPALWKLPLLSGPHTYNFAAISEQFVRADALQIVDNAEQLLEALLALFARADLREQRGANALALVEKNRGALDKQLALIARQLNC